LAQEESVLADTTRSVHNSVRLAALDYQHNEKQAHLVLQAIALADQSIQSNEKNYLLGLRTGTDVLVARQKRWDLQRQWTQAQVLMLQATGKWIAAVGRTPLRDAAVPMESLFTNAPR
jgi:outer membrane protein TolC